MSKNRFAGYQDTLTVSKCKRIVRPLISKINALNDLNSKYPSLLDFDFPYDREYPYKVPDIERKVFGSDYTTKYPSNNIDTKNIQKKHTRKNDSPDYKPEVRCVSSSPEIIRGFTEDSLLNSHQIKSLIEPVDSFERLRSLKPFVSIELYQAYDEIFLIFRNIMSLLILNKQEPTHTAKVAKLASLSSFKIGKFIALSTKSTYFKLNQSLLFDANTLPFHLREYLETLSNDLDEWLEMKPELISCTYRIDLLFGYLIHLLVINLDLTLYLLIPVLVHWLYEELRSQDNVQLSSIMRSLFLEYWTYGSDYTHNTDFGDIITTLNGGQNRKQNFTVFWVFFKIGYWKHFIQSLDLQLNNFSVRSYESVMLDTIPLNNKLNLEDLTEIGERLHRSDFLHEIYLIIRNNPQHPQVNNILILIVTQTIANTRMKLRKCHTISLILNCLAQSYKQVQVFVRLWLSLPVNENNLVYNSLYPGNKEIFEALVGFTDYQVHKCNFLLVNVTSYCIGGDLEKDIILFKNRIRILRKTLKLLQSYFLDTSVGISITAHEVGAISESMVLILEYNFTNPNLKKLNSVSNPNFNDLLIWLFAKQEATLLNIAQLCFKEYYGARTWYKDKSVHQLHYLFFECDNQDTGSSSEDINVSKLDTSDEDNDSDNWDERYDIHDKRHKMQTNQQNYIDYLH